MKLQSSFVTAARIALAWSLIAGSVSIARDSKLSGSANQVDAARTTLRGSLRDAAGAVVEGATVEAWYSPRLSDSMPFTSGIEDVVTTKTDDRGHFRLTLLRGTVYSVAAYWTTPDGEHRQSSIVDTMGDRVLSLEQSEEASGQRLDVRVRGDRVVFGVRGELRATVFVDAANSRRIATKPIVGTDPVLFDVPFTAEHSVVKVLLEDAIGPISIHAQRMPKTRKNFDIRVLLTLPTGPPVHFRVVDTAGKPIASATLVSRARLTESAPWRPHATTDEDGRATLRSIADFDKHWVVCARATGYRDAIAFRNVTSGQVGGQTITDWDIDRTIVLTMTPGPPVIGRILDEHGRGVPGVPVAATYDITKPHGMGRTCTVTSTDHEGRFRYEPAANTDSLRLVAVLPPAEHSRLTRDAVACPSPRIDLVAPGPNDDGRTPVVDFGTATLRTIQIRGPGGQPAPGAAIVTLSDRFDSLVDAMARSPRADKRGYVAFYSFGGPMAKTPRDNSDVSPHESVFAILEGIGWSEIRRSETASSATTRIQLEPFTRREVVVVDEERRPVAGVWTNANVSMRSGERDATLQHFLVGASFLGLRQKSDSDGRMVLWSVDRPGMLYRMRFQPPDRNYRIVECELPPPSEDWLITLTR
ncbi:MAG: carboxypeptidase regulatory-like domain-containing protein [Planctomycetes bacterium]|nr:carboxypeptidase regulatory-like domain-containing protein [Planctomycetota bacterium]